MISIKTLDRILTQLNKLCELVEKHSDHDQSSHGRGGGARVNLVPDTGAQLGGGGSATLTDAARATQERSERAKRSHKPSTKAKQRRGYAEQAFIAKITGGKDTLKASHPFDVLYGNAKEGKKKGGIGVEVKTVLDNKNDKITMHPPSRRRKEAYAKKHGMETHTVMVDARGTNKKYYYKAGVGAYRMSAMERVTLKELKGMFR